MFASCVRKVKNEHWKKQKKIKHLIEHQSLPVLHMSEGLPYQPHTTDLPAKTTGIAVKVREEG